jgi:hypothetical protein
MGEVKRGANAGEVPTEKMIRAAHHESGHIVIAAKLGLKLRPEGLSVDPAGNGLACYHKDPEDSDSSRECVALASFAGFKAEIRLCEQRSYTVPDAVGVLHSPDWCEARKTISKLSDSFLVSDGLGKVQHRLETRTAELVSENWSVIVALAMELLASPWEPLEPLKSGAVWSQEKTAKHLSGAEAVKTLGQCGIVAICSGPT